VREVLAHRWHLAGVLAVLVLASLFAFVSLMKGSAEEVEIPVHGNAEAQAKLIALTPQQCQQAKSSAANGMETVRRELSKLPDSETALRTWESEYEATRAWAEAGCPEDGKRGFIPDASGNGGQMILFPNSVSFDGSTHSSGSGTITLVPRETTGD